MIKIQLFDCVMLNVPHSHRHQKVNYWSKNSKNTSIVNVIGSIIMNHASYILKNIKINYI